MGGVTLRRRQTCADCSGQAVIGIGATCLATECTEIFSVGDIRDGSPLLGTEISQKGRICSGLSFCSVFGRSVTAGDEARARAFVPSGSGVGSNAIPTRWRSSRCHGPISLFAVPASGTFASSIARNLRPISRLPLLNLSRTTKLTGRMFSASRVAAASLGVADRPGAFLQGASRFFGATILRFRISAVIQAGCFGSTGRSSPDRRPS